MRVRLASVTDHWATFAVVGPNSRKVLQKVCQDIDFANAAFPFMSYREGTVAGAASRVMRISFSGELAYEVNVPANVGRAVWEALMAAGARVRHHAVRHGNDARAARGEGLHHRRPGHGRLDDAVRPRHGRARREVEGLPRQALAHALGHGEGRTQAARRPALRRSVVRASRRRADLSPDLSRATPRRCSVTSRRATTVRF